VALSGNQIENRENKPLPKRLEKTGPLSYDLLSLATQAIINHRLDPLSGIPILEL
jgi:hypothetical protein